MTQKLVSEQVLVRRWRQIISESSSESVSDVPMMATQPQNLILSPFSLHPLSLFPSSLSPPSNLSLYPFRSFHPSHPRWTWKAIFSSPEGPEPYDIWTLVSDGWWFWTLYNSCLLTCGCTHKDVIKATRSLSWCLFRGAYFAVPISLSRFRDANFAAQILRRKFCGANFATQILRGLRGIRFCRFGKIQNHDLGDSNPRSLEFVIWSLPLGYAASDF